METLPTKIRIGLFFGGQSPEHEVSLQSAFSVATRIDREKYEVIPIGIDREGFWHFFSEQVFYQFVLEGNLNILAPSNINLHVQREIPKKSRELFSPHNLKKLIDIAFSILHGPLGEDGTIQGFFELANIPFIGCRTLSSAMCMDKSVTKNMLAAHGLPTNRFRVLMQASSMTYDEIVEEFGLPFFVKPCSLGSSIGVSKVSCAQSATKAIEHAFTLCSKVMIEECIKGRELECGILEGSSIIASAVGEICTTHSYYSYTAKYQDPTSSQQIVPAEITSTIKNEVQCLAKKAFQALQCRGLARVDFFLQDNGKLYINEINSLPGFTPSSLFPVLFDQIGIDFKTVVGTLIESVVNDLNFSTDQK